MKVEKKLFVRRTLIVSMLHFKQKNSLQGKSLIKR